MGPILLGAPLPSQRCMRDLGTDSIPTGYKFDAASVAYRWGLRLGSKANLRRVVRLDKQTEPRRAHSWHGHYSSARAFAVNPARLKARPLRARGLTAQRGQARGLFMPRMERCASREDGNPAQCAIGEAPVRLVVARPTKTVTPRPSYKRVSSVARELAASPMMLFARRFEHAMAVTV
jgi:hypothetical protein